MVQIKNLLQPFPDPPFSARSTCRTTRSARYTFSMMLLFRTLLVATVVVTVLAASARAANGKQAQKPHVVFQLVDDNGWAGVGYNNPYIKTPTLDALAAGGLTLTAQYVYQYCAPTRGSFLTGRYPYVQNPTSFCHTFITLFTHVGSLIYNIC